jgi:hypothetical protein
MFIKKNHMNDINQVNSHLHKIDIILSRFYLKLRLIKY